LLSRSDLLPLYSNVLGETDVTVKLARRSVANLLTGSTYSKTDDGEVDRYT
jgi:hypothetical protein